MFGRDPRGSGIMRILTDQDIYKSTVDRLKEMSSQLKS